MSSSEQKRLEEMALHLQAHISDGLLLVISIWPLQHTSLALGRKPGGPKCLDCFEGKDGITGRFPK